ncbi:MAG: hypothetical protein KAJ64_02320 [Thermoplasmata archaeon]|nr:hypothetical protein [Thermoplasmata archaeon]
MEIKLDNPEYNEIFTKSPGLMSIPYFNKDGPILGPSEYVIFHVIYLDLGVTFFGKTVNKKGEIEEKAHPILSGTGVPDAWQIMITNERVLAFIPGRSMGAGLLATPLYAIAMNNVWMVFQQPLSAVEEIGLVYSKPGFWNKEHSIGNVYITFGLAQGNLSLSATGSGIKNFHHARVSNPAMKDVMKGINENKARIHDILYSDEVIDLEAFKTSTEKYRQEPPEPETKESERSLIYRYITDPLIFHSPLYAEDLRLGYQKITLKKREKETPEEQPETVSSLKPKKVE